MKTLGKYSVKTMAYLRNSGLFNQVAYGTATTIFTKISLLLYKLIISPKHV